jgi:hypothetical protein
MAWKRVSNYSLGYSIPSNQFFFYYTLVGEPTTHQLFLSAHEFTALADMFRNEGPITFNTDGKYFASAAEQVGENETAP